jgi:hypothetical protein
MNFRPHIKTFLLVLAVALGALALFGAAASHPAASPVAGWTWDDGAALNGSPTGWTWDD